MDSNNDKHGKTDDNEKVRADKHRGMAVNGEALRALRPQSQVEEVENGIERGEEVGNEKEKEVETDAERKKRQEKTEAARLMGLTLSVGVEGEELPVMDLLRGITKECGKMVCCRKRGDNRWEITMENNTGKEKLLDGLIIKERRVVAAEMSADTRVVSFLHVPGYVSDQKIIEKLWLWGVKPVSGIKRRKWPGTEIQDGTRFVRVKFTKDVSSLPYSAKFETMDGVEHIRVLHDAQQRVCRHCLQPGHIMRECPEFCCFKCGTKGHFARECTKKKEEEREEEEEEEEEEEQVVRPKRKEVVVAVEEMAAEEEGEMEESGGGGGEEEEEEKEEEEEPSEETAAQEVSMAESGEGSAELVAEGDLSEPLASPPQLYLSPAKEVPVVQVARKSPAAEITRGAGAEEEHDNVPGKPARVARLKEPMSEKTLRDLRMSPARSRSRGRKETSDDEESRPCAQGSRSGRKGMRSSRSISRRGSLDNDQ